MSGYYMMSYIGKGDCVHVIYAGHMYTFMHERNDCMLQDYHTFKKRMYIGEL